MATLIRIDSIKVDRELEPGDDVNALAAHIRDSGMKHPVIVDANMKLIDGLRRIEAIKLLGGSTILATLTETLEDTAKALKRTRKHGICALPVSYARAYQIYRAVHEQVEERGNRMRTRTKQEREAQPDTVRSRAMIADAIGKGSESHLATMAVLYREFNRTDVSEKQRLALDDLRAKLENDTLSLHEARGRLTKILRPGFDGDTIGLTEQRNMIGAALMQINAANKGITRLGEISDEFTPEEVQVYLDGFQQARSDIYRIVSTLKKWISEQ